MYSSRASSFAHLDNLPQPLEMDVNVPRTLGGVHTSSPNTFTDIQGLAPLNKLNGAQPGSLSDYPLKHWYNSHSNEDPVTARIIGASQGKTKPSHYGTSPGGVPHSDSGYGTAQIPSVGNPSVFEDSMETHSLIGNQQDLTFSSSLNRDAYPTNELSTSPWSQSSALQPPAALSSNSGKAPLICPECNKTCKTPSELT